ncbi:MAG: endo-1,4-beta-xylanase [Limisphaerales bacterium]
MRFLQLITIAFLLGCSTGSQQPIQARAKWTETKANSWYAKQPWHVGCNFAPSTAINQLEMWQAETWDPKTIDRELGFARSLGFTSVRVFLHDLAWKQDPKGFINRMDQFLGMADKHHIGVMYVIFDSVWDPFPQAGKQRDPRPHTHNSGWVQSPGAKILASEQLQDELKAYVQDVVGHFRNDRRVQVWDIFNEPDNPVPQYHKVELPNKKEAALQLLKKTFTWAREMNPSQPLTSGVWIGNWGNPDKLTPMEHEQLEESDIITFHNYSKLPEIKKCIDHLRRYNRPIVCSEYMARPMGSTFNPVLGYLKEQHVGAYNWGFVSGKTQTIFPWDSWEKQYGDEPPTWFHDIFRADGTPYNQEEVRYIREVTRDARHTSVVQPERGQSAAAPLAFAAH